MDDNTIIVLIIMILVFIIAGIFIFCTPNSNTKVQNSTKMIPQVRKYNKMNFNFSRLSPKSSCSLPLSTVPCSFPSIEHPIKKLPRCNLLQDIVSPNHWIGNTLFQKNNTFSIFPYLGSITDDSFTFGWPSDGTLTNPGPPNQCDLSYNVNSNHNITISGENCTSCDILDMDALVTTVIWNNLEGSVTIPLAKGSPYITMEINNASISLKCDFDYTLHSFSEGRDYVISITETTGYIIYLSHNEVIQHNDKTLIIPQMIGVVRIAYFASDNMLQSLSNFYPYYPVESTISTTSTLNGSQRNIISSYTWTSKSMTNNIGPVLMMALPHHNIINITYEPFTFNHPLMGNTRLIITDKNTWNLSYSLPDYTFPYSTIINNDLLSIWTTEIVYIIDTIPDETVSWMKWMGSLANMILLGAMLKQDISVGLNLLLNELALIQENHGVISKNNILVYDDTWGGTIGVNDEDSTLYDCHIGQFGYLVYAYAVAGYFNSQFIQDNRDTALYFARNIGNPCDSDPEFPLWRNKDWYLGYSLASGLQENLRENAEHSHVLDLSEKNATNMGETTFGYYSLFLLAKVLNHNDLTNWSISMLASEITSAKTYYQTTNTPPFISITDRGDTYYKYTSRDTSIYPERNASDIIPIIKPLSLLSSSYVDSKWAQSTYPQMELAINTTNIFLTPDSLYYALSLLGTNPQQKEQILTLIKNNSSKILSAGNTWSELLYWILI